MTKRYEPKVEIIKKQEGLIKAIIPVTLEELEAADSLDKNDNLLDLYASRAGLDMDGPPDDWSITARSVVGFTVNGNKSNGTIWLRVVIEWTPREGR